MKTFSFKLWAIGFWLAASLMVLTAKADFCVTFAALVSLTLCVSVIKSNREEIEKMLQDMK